MKGIQRFTRGSRCPICGGCDDDPRSQGTRCHGYIDGGWAHCSREEHAGKAEFSPGSSTYGHRIRGKCPCGVDHAPAPAGKPELVHVYKYRDAGGQVLFEVVRYRLPNGEKTFKQRRPLPGGGFQWSLKGIEPVLYQFPALRTADPATAVWITEGEKDADRLGGLGLLATCNPMGAGKWRESYAQALAGRSCYVLPDNDQVGRDHAQAVARSLSAHGCKVKLVTLPDLPEHGDVSDFLDGQPLQRLIELARASPEWTEAAAAGQPNPEPKEKEDASQAGILKRIAATAELFRTPEGEGYCTVQANGRTEHHPIGSRAVEDWLTYQYMEQVDRAPGSEALSQIIATMRARARFSRTEIPVGIRVAADPIARDPLAPVYYLDLANEKGQVVRISAAGWAVLDQAPVKFSRPKGMGALPVPVRGGSLEPLWQFVNVEEADRILLIAVLTHSLLPVSPQPITVLMGEQGSCKSTLAEVLKRCVDPRRPMLGTPPGDVRDLSIIASNTWVMAFDNLSRVRPWFSDALCRLAYGSGFETRSLHTNDELTSFEACRPVIITGIDDLVTRNDLLDRAVMLTCPTIEDKDRRYRDEFWRDFEVAHPCTLGALLDAVAGGLAVLPTLEKLCPPRMATFGRWGEAVCRHLGWQPGELLEAFSSNQQSASAELLEDSPLVQELMSLGRLLPVFEGPASELYELVNERASPGSRASLKWPRGPQSLSCHLRRLAPALRRQGIQVEFAPRRSQSRLISVRWCPAVFSSLADGVPTSANKVQNASFASFASSAGNGQARGDLLQGEGRQGSPF